VKTIIDVAMDVSPFAADLRRAGIATVIRYYNHQNSRTLPSKCLSLEEARELTAAGLSLAVVFQQRGGAHGNLSGLDADGGAKDAARALALAETLGQPKMSAIYFAIDHDYVKESELVAITSYFSAIRAKLEGKYAVGCYGSGTVGERMKAAGFVDYIWLSGSRAWSGTQQMLPTDRWSLFQEELNVPFPGAGFRFDGNAQSPAFPNFGQFVLDGAPLQPPARPLGRTVMEVTARAGLRLRAGPGATFEAQRTLPLGSLVEAKRQIGEWIEVDLEGDGATDGYMHAGFLRTVYGGITTPHITCKTPLDVARAELDLDVVEVPGKQSNPRILRYHATTAGGAMDDDVAWCSSFVNYCVEQAGLRGTDSKAALSWHVQKWGTDVTASPREGDIAVFQRRQAAETGSVIGGHVGFWLEETTDSVRLLGGNQSNRVNLTSYPKAGMLGQNFYRLLSIRRA
jgi:uncharacterized protein (TIGR02594 family)